MSRILIKLLHPLPYWASAAPRREVRSVYFANYLWLSHILKKTAIFIIESSQAAQRGWVCVRVWIECRSIDCRRKVGYIQYSNTREQTTAKRFRILGRKIQSFSLATCRTDATLQSAQRESLLLALIVAPLPSFSCLLDFSVAWQAPQNTIMQMSSRYFANSIRNALTHSHCSARIHFYWNNMIIKLLVLQSSAP